MIKNKNTRMLSNRILKGVVNLRNPTYWKAIVKIQEWTDNYHARKQKSKKNHVYATVKDT